MDTRSYVKKMSDLLILTEKNMVRKEGSLTETLHLGGDPHQPSHDDASRTGLGRLALDMQPPFDTHAGGHSEVGVEGPLHPDTHKSTDEESGKPVAQLESEPAPDHGETSMGTQDPMGKDAPVSGQPYQTGSQDGMVVPPDRKGEYDDTFFASMTNEDLVSMFRSGLIDDIRESLGGEATDRDIFFAAIQGGLSVEEAYDLVYEGNTVVPELPKDMRDEMIEAIRRRIVRVGSAAARSRQFRVHDS